MRHDHASHIVIEALQRISADRMRTHGKIINGLHAFDHILNNLDHYDRLLRELEDDESREVLKYLMGNRIAFYLEQSKARASELFPPQISPARWADLVHKASLHPASRLEVNLEVDVVENWVLDGYSLPGICEVVEGDIVFDCGAFNGNSTISLAAKAGDSGLVYAFEPNPEMAETLRRNLNASKCRNVEIVQKALMENSGVVRFSQAGAASRPNDRGGIEVPATTIDEFVQNSGLTRLDFLKLDIEGYELPVLRGAVETIRRFRPKMALSVYHLHYDLTDIPLYLKKICQWYKLFLRHNAPYDGEVVLFMPPLDRMIAHGRSR